MHVGLRRMKKERGIFKEDSREDKDSALNCGWRWGLFFGQCVIGIRADDVRPSEELHKKWESKMSKWLKIASLKWHHHDKAKRDAQGKK